MMMAAMIKIQLKRMKNYAKILGREWVETKSPGVKNTG